MEYKILCYKSIEDHGFMESEFTKKINNESINYDAISIGGVNDRICVLMKKKL